jgi:hypothetical protein
MFSLRSTTLSPCSALIGMKDVGDLELRGEVRNSSTIRS